MDGSHRGDDIRLHNAVDRRDFLENGRVGVGARLAIELGDELVVGEGHHAGERAAAQVERLELAGDIRAVLAPRSNSMKR